VLSVYVLITSMVRAVLKIIKLGII